MANLGLALNKAVPTLVDIGERAARLRMEQKMLPYKQAQILSTIEGQNIQNEMAILTLEEAKRNQTERAKPVNMGALPDHPVVRAMYNAHISLGGNKIPTKGDVEDRFADMQKNPQLYQPFFQKEWDDASLQASVRKIELEQANKITAKNQAILQSKTATNEEKAEAQKEIEKAQEDLKLLNTQEEFDKYNKEVNDLLPIMSAFDKAIPIQNFLQQHQSELEQLQRTNPQAYNAVVMSLGMGNIEGAKGAQEILGNMVKTREDTNITDFEIFYRGYKQEHPNATDAEISRAADERGVKKAGDTAEARANRTKRMVQTDTGIVFVNPRTGETTFIKDEKGQQVYGRTPSEIKTSHKNLNDNIAAVEGVREIFNKGSVGPVTGRINKLGNKFFNNADFTVLKNRLAQLRIVVYGFSGKQINEVEQEWLKNDVIPAIEQPNENLIASLDEFDTWVKRHKRLLEEEYPAMAQMGGETSAQRINVISPTGKKGTIPVEQLKDAEKQGYKRIK